MAEQKLETFNGLGMDSGRGNLLGIQAWMETADYASEAAFYARLSGYLEAARRKGWLNPRTIAVFPEYIGTWLVAAGEGRAVFRAATLRAAMQALVLAHPLAFARGMLAAREKGRVEASLFRMKARGMAHSYTAVFSRLAKTYGVTVVAGSILLPEAQVAGLDVKPGANGAPLQNVTAVFRPDGSPHNKLARKCYPILAEQPFVQPAALDALPVFDTPAGRLGVLVCADAWYPAPYDRLRRNGVQLLAVPSFIDHAGAWDSPWGGYNGSPAPQDVDPGDIQRLSEGQAWRKYALAGRLSSSGAQAGINVFLQASLWDMTSDGLSLAIKGDETTAVRTRRGALLNQWL